MNATLRSVLLTTSLIASAFGAVVYSSCAEDKCKAIVCANGSVCNQGACICPTGYEGSSCEVTNRDRFKGTWQVSEDGSLSASAQYAVVVDNGDGITQLVIKNFNNSVTSNVQARVKGDSIYIDPQTFANNIQIVGAGYVADDKFYGVDGRITLRYKVTSASGLVNNYGYDADTVNPSQPSIWTK